MRYLLRTNIHLQGDRIWCDPTGGFATAGVIMALTAAAGGYAAWGQGQAGKAEKARNEYEAQLAETQAALVRRTAEQNKKLTQGNAAEASKTLAQRTMELEGTQKATAAASGIGGGSVTTADIASDTVTKEALDQAAIKYNADINTWNIEEEAKSNEWMLKNKAKQYRMAGKNAVDASKIAATSTLLNTATSVASAAQYPYYKSKIGKLYTPGWELAG